MTDDTTARAGQKCSERVHDKGRWPSFHQCPRPGSVERDGKFYCKQHDPVAVRSKRDARDAKWESDWNAACAKNARTAAALRSFEPMRDALEEARRFVDTEHQGRQFAVGPCTKDDPGYTDFVKPAEDMLAQIDAALALAE